VPVITVAAPPGYGKTMLMAQWAQRTESRVAWLSCDDADNDPVVLLSALAVTLGRIGLVDPAIFSALASSGADITVVPRFVAAVAPVQPPVMVLIDHVEAVTNRHFEANSMPEQAIGHAQAAGDYDRVARLILELQQPVWASGRVETVLRWMEWLGDVMSADHYGAIAVHGSLIFALLGQPSEAERWAAAAERASPAGILPDGSTMQATLADPVGAAAVLAQAHDILQQRPDLGVLPELAGQLQAGLATGNTRAIGASSLTAAELRLLPLLSTHLSYAEIGERLYVSKNTVKTQAYSAYRKLGVSSRSEAVVRTRELGLDAL